MNDTLSTISHNVFQNFHVIQPQDKSHNAGIIQDLEQRNEFLFKFYYVSVVRVPLRVSSLKFMLFGVKKGKKFILVAICVCHL